MEYAVAPYCQSTYPPASMAEKVPPFIGCHRNFKSSLGTIYMEIIKFVAIFTVTHTCSCLF